MNSYLLSFNFPGSLNDVWKFSPSNNMWTWVSGSNTGYQRGIYGTLGVPNITNIPGSRYGSVSWIDSHDILWLFGGKGYAQSGGKGLYILFVFFYLF